MPEPFKTRFCIQSLRSAIMTESTEKKTVAKRAAGLSDEVLESVGARQQSAIEAVRKFVDTLDEAMPNLVDPSMRKKISTPPWIWPSRSPRRRTSSCAASGAARAGR
jgi:hypothetical protein